MTSLKSHPRYASLKTRELLEKGVREGITSLNGLIAHGRGEAFDYLLSEKTHLFAEEAIEAASGLLLLAKRPVISVNGNTAALIPRELVRLAALLKAPIEINLFHASSERGEKIKKYLEKFGAGNVLLPSKKYKTAGLTSSRKYVNREGVYKADVVFVPLEDGDRTEALIKSGKQVITVDLNPLSRTAQAATITVVDNIVRAVPLLVHAVDKQAKLSEKQLRNLVEMFDQKRSLRTAIAEIRKK